MKKKLVLKFDGMNEMLSKEQMKAIKGGELRKSSSGLGGSLTYSWCCCVPSTGYPPPPSMCGHCDKKGTGACNGDGRAWACSWS